MIKRCPMVVWLPIQYSEWFINYSWLTNISHSWTIIRRLLTTISHHQQWLSAILIYQKDVRLMCQDGHQKISWTNSPLLMQGIWFSPPCSFNRARARRISWFLGVGFIQVDTGSVGKSPHSGLVARPWHGPSAVTPEVHGQHKETCSALGIMNHCRNTGGVEFPTVKWLLSSDLSWVNC